MLDTDYVALVFLGAGLCEASNSPYFDRACVTLIAASKAKAIAQNILERYMRSGDGGRILVREVN